MIGLVPSNMYKPSRIFTDSSRRFKDPFLSFVFCVCVLAVPCSLWSPTEKELTPLALLYVMFDCVFAYFINGVLGQVWYLIVSIPDLCLLPYFYKTALLH